MRRLLREVCHGSVHVVVGQVQVEACVLGQLAGSQSTAVRRDESDGLLCEKLLVIRSAQSGFIGRSYGIDGVVREVGDGVMLALGAALVWRGAVGPVVGLRSRVVTKKSFETTSRWGQRIYMVSKIPLSNGVRFVRRMVRQQV